MAYVLADNIISPLGNTSEENYLSVKAGKSGIRTFEPESHGIPEGFTASLLSDDEQSPFKHGDFEHLAIASAQQAMSPLPLDWGSDRVVFILSSTKGAIEKLQKKENKTGENEESVTGESSKGKSEESDLSSSAQRIAQRLGITTTPIVVCNACISGLSALILGSRLIEEGRYDYAVVCGVDCPDRFIISGFQSLKALSTIPCRPFDIERFGLNLGEAAATIVLGKNVRRRSEDAWQIGAGYVKNDAFHISAPSKTAEGLYAALSETLQQAHLQGMTEDKEDGNAITNELAFVNAHGTATLFNDQMESIAIQRAGLSSLPTNALKGYFGHTLGAAGILETIISMKAIDDHTILGTRGFEELGVSGKVNISTESLPTDKHAFIKMLSGFGGCNATLWASKGRKNIQFLSSHTKEAGAKQHTIKITPEEIVVDGKLWEESPSLTTLYKQHIGDYPKYYKMDGLSRLGFVASEILLQQEGKDEEAKGNHAFSRAIVLFNHSSSIASDRKYLSSIANAAEYFPSPSVFVYTLPNIVTGEIAMRHGYHGETSFYILPHKDESQMHDILRTAFLDPATQSILGGWIDYEDEAHFEAELSIYS